MLVLACSRGDRRATQRYQRLRLLPGTKPGEQKTRTRSAHQKAVALYIRRTMPERATGTTLATPSRQDVTRTHHTRPPPSSPPRRNIRTRVAPYANTDNERTSLAYIHTGAELQSTKRGAPATGQEQTLRPLTRMGTRFARFARRYPSYFRSRSAVLLSNTARALNPCFRAWGRPVEGGARSGSRVRRSEAKQYSGIAALGYARHPHMILRDSQSKR